MPSCSGKDLGTGRGQAASAGQPRAHVGVQAAAGGGVVVAPAQALEDAVARELAGIEAGEAAVGAEGGGAGIAGAGAALVAVAVADHAATVAQGEAVRQQPLDGAPGRANLQRRPEERGGGGGEVGVAPAARGKST